MSPFEIGASRPVGPVQVNTAKTTRAPNTQGADNVPAAPEVSTAAQVERSTALNAGQSAPVDFERVKVIRHAIETGSYPVIPTKIADAMIAAGMLLRTTQ